VLLVTGEDRLALLVAKREVDVAGVSLALVVLGHEGNAAALLGGDLLRAELEQSVLVALVGQFRVFERDLVLAVVALTFERLDNHPGAPH